MDDFVNPVIGQGPAHGVNVGGVGLDERQVGPGQGAQGVDGGRRRVGQVVEDDHLTTGIVEGHRGVTADVARSAGNQDGHVKRPRGSGRQTGIDRRRRSAPRR